MIGRLGVSMIGALLSGLALAACAADEPPAADPCQKLTGAERAECEQRGREQDREPAATPPPEAQQTEPPPPDTKSEGNEQSDTADPPQA